jgi:hypothetical protein
MMTMAVASSKSAAAPSNRGLSMFYCDKDIFTY